MHKFFVDFEFAGHIEVEAETAEEAIEIVAEKMSIEELVENIQNFNVGRHYVERI
ncbi:MAG: hypothetical protein AB1488_03895 [Nitrospirota bacterium]